MIRNYLTIALRTLRRNVGYTAINLIGLAVGLAACILIGLYVRHELSYDDFHEKSDRIYRVVEHRAQGQSRLMHSAQLAPALNREFAAINQAVRLSKRWGEDIKVNYGEHAYYEDDFLFVDSRFFNVFSFSLRRGNPEMVLSDPFSAVITEQAAEKYFGEENPVGKTIEATGYSQAHELTVTGVAENSTPTSHFQFDVLVSFSTLRRTMPKARDLNSWEYIGHYTYALLEKGAEPSAFERSLAAFVGKQRSGTTAQKGGQEEATFAYELQPITDIHLHSHYDRELEANSSIRYIYLFAALALLILILACVNYVNLMTAQAQRRAREVGVRKTVGAGRWQLIRQHLGESALLCAAALIGALVLAQMALPFFSDLVGVQLGVHLFDPTTLLLVLSLGAVVSLVAGAYPAFFLSAFQPAEAIEGEGKVGAGSNWLRKGLVVFQFAIAVALIAGTALLYQQLHHMQTKRLGLEEEQVVAIHARDALHGAYSAFKQELFQQAGVSEVTSSNTLLPATEEMSASLVPEDADKEKWQSNASVVINSISVDSDFREVMGVPLLAGRDLSSATKAEDVTPVLINETAAEALDWKDPVGKTFPCCLRSTLRVVGVVGDFHYQTLRQEIKPLVIMENTYAPQYVLARVQGGEPSQSLETLRKEWQKVSDAPFEYSFLDRRFEEIYRAERRMASAFSAFAGLAILIACLGLLGLAAYAARRREKEIGIRKALGATATNVVALLSKEFLLLVGVACAIAVPVAYVGMERWLQDFAYRVDVSPWLFVGASGLALAIALATISVQALRAARTDPATTLRDE